jgi:poly-gamma-glutamate synthesis protein (capsule biosynthesis protein)
MRIAKSRLKRRRKLRTISTIVGLILVISALVFAVLNLPDQNAKFKSSPVDSPITAVEPPKVISIDLVGDVNFADGWGADYADSHGHSVAAAFSPELLDHLKSADIFYANHEFTMSTRGVKLNKYYTFRANPSKADYWQQLGVDVVGLANNHAYDYGEPAFLDTLDTLDSIGIKHVGAGKNLDEAMAPAIFNIDGYKVAFVAADRSQKSNEIRAAAAGKNTPGVLFCFDDALFIQAVKTARESADFVIAIPHWGTEVSTVLEPVQISLGQKLIDAGADVVVGAHPHILQGMDYYNGKLIAHSLGNFWFNTQDIPTAILNITITNGTPSYKIIPALQSGQRVATSDQIRTDVFSTMRKLSPNVEIDYSGKITSQTKSSD